MILNSGTRGRVRIDIIEMRMSELACKRC